MTSAPSAIEQAAVEMVHGKPIDLNRLKAAVLSNLRAQSQHWSQRARQMMPLTVEVATCPLCGSDAFDELFAIHGFFYRQCRVCTHVFNSRRLADDHAGAFYESTNQKINYSDTYTDRRAAEYRFEQVAMPKVRFVAERQPPPGCWLDVGAGNGDVVAAAQRAGYEAIGLEPNAASAEYGRKAYGVMIEQRTLDQFAADCDGGFAVVSFLGLLDLVPSPMTMLETAASLLADGGVVFASLPNYESLSTDVQRTYPDQVICRHMYPTVMNVFTFASACAALRRAGLEPIAAWFFGMDVYELLYNLTLSSPGFADSPAHRSLQERMNELQLVYDRARRCDKFHLLARKTPDPADSREPK